MVENVLLTGVYGRCGTALIDHLHDRDEYEFTYYNRSDRPEDHPYGGYDTVVGNVTDFDRLDEAMSGQDAVVHLAAYPYTDGDWNDVFEPNIVGMYNALETARRNEVESFVFGSTNHVMGLYEEEHAPALYEPGYGLVLDHTDPVRPDRLRLRHRHRRRRHRRRHPHHHHQNRRHQTHHHQWGLMHHLQTDPIQIHPHCRNHRPRHHHRHQNCRYWMSRRRKKTARERVTIVAVSHDSPPGRTI